MKDVIYLDIEDDITSTIGKFKRSKSKIVALVPPKRSNVLASVVNLKLLKKASESSGKQLVLITTDDTLCNLAGGLEMYVAKNLTTQPEVPTSTDSPELPSDVIESSDQLSETTTGEESDKKEEAAGAVNAAAAAKETAKQAPTSLKSRLKKLKPIKKDKQLPNFERFRKRLILGAVAILLLIAGGVWANTTLPQAQVSLRGQTSRITLDEEVRFSTNVTEVDIENNVIPAQRKSIEATQEVSAPATGEKNIGEKAEGEITIENCMQSNSFTLSEGTRLRHSTGLVYSTTKKVTVPGGDFDVSSGNNVDCVDPGKASVSVVASEPGGNYNLAATSSDSYENDPYVVANFSSTQNNSLRINGDSMGGGTDEIIKTVTEDDIATARDKLTDDDIGELTNELATQFEGDVVLLEKTITTDDEKDVVSHNPGDQADAVSITRTARYSVYAAGRDVFNQFLNNKITGSLSEDQAVVDTGIDSIIYALLDVSSEVAAMQIKVNAIAGPDVDIPSLQEKLSGLSYTEGIAAAEEIEGILKAEIELSPFWVSGMPKRAENIDITVEIVGLEDESNQAAPDDTQSDGEAEQDE